MTFVTKLLQHTQEFNHDEKSRAQARHLPLWVPGDFSMLVYRGGVLFHTPFQDDILLKKIIVFRP